MDCCSVILETGDDFFAEIGAEHVAHPIGEARILVVEREGGVRGGRCADEERRRCSSSIRQ